MSEQFAVLKEDLATLICQLDPSRRRNTLIAFLIDVEVRSSEVDLAATRWLRGKKQA